MAHFVFGDDADMVIHAVATKKPASCGLEHVMVGMTGFEPATSHSRSERSTKLSHIPVLQKQR